MFRCIQGIIKRKSAGQKLPDVAPDTLNNYFLGIGVRTVQSVAAARPANTR